MPKRLKVACCTLPTEPLSLRGGVADAANAVQCSSRHSMQVAAPSASPTVTRCACSCRQHAPALKAMVAAMAWLR